MKTLKVKKSYIVFFILANIQLIVNSQPYYPLVGPNKLWSYYQYWIGGGFSYYVKFTQDTTINNSVYKKVMRSNDANHSTWANYGYISETMDKKVFYIKNNIDTVKRLYYDFNANVGDTLHLYHCDLYVNSKDSILICTKYRKRFNLIGQPYNVTWIEGIGTLNKFNDEGICIQGVGELFSLLCFTENDTLKYMNPTFNFCYHGTMDINETTKDNFYFELYPNPTDDILYFKTNLVNNLSIQFYDVLGNNILIKSIKNGDYLYLDKSIFITGIYFYQVKNNENIVKTGKLVIQ